MVAKRCFKCGHEKPMTEFYKHTQMGDGHLNKCKDCTKRDAREHRLLNLAAVREYDRRRASQAHRITARKVYQQTDAYKVSTARARSVYARKYPNKTAARNAVNNAIRDGRLTREPCFICGAEAEAHHSDYSAPLIVTWLCDLHHKQVHKEAREYDREKLAA